MEAVAPHNQLVEEEAWEPFATLDAHWSGPTVHLRVGRPIFESDSHFNGQWAYAEPVAQKQAKFMQNWKKPIFTTAPAGTSLAGEGGWPVRVEDWPHDT